MIDDEEAIAAPQGETLPAPEFEIDETEEHTDEESGDEAAQTEDDDEGEDEAPDAAEPDT